MHKLINISKGITIWINITKSADIDTIFMVLSHLSTTEQDHYRIGQALIYRTKY